MVFTENGIAPFLRKRVNIHQEVYNVIGYIMCFEDPSKNILFVLREEETWNGQQLKF